MEKQLFRVTKTRVRGTGEKFSWQYKPRVRYGGLQMAVQTYVYYLFDNPKKYNVKVELLDVKTIGEIDMNHYMKRNSIEMFVKQPEMSVSSN